MAAAKRPREWGDEVSDSEDVITQLARAMVYAARERETATAPTMIARGNFGCVYSPPLPCADGRMLGAGSRGAVSKLSLADDDHETERQVLSTLEEVDPDHRYHVRYFGDCEVGPEQGRDCDLEEEEDYRRPRRILVMEGGLPFDASSVDEDRVAQQLDNLWAGLELLARNRIRYHDLHAGNIVLGRHDGLMRLVDFGGCELDVPPAGARAGHLREVTDLVRDSLGASAAARSWLDRLIFQSTAL
jgi:hypothetical protein